MQVYWGQTPSIPFLVLVPMILVNGKPLSQTKQIICTTWKVLTWDYDCGLIMIFFSLFSIQMVDGFMAPLGIDIAFWWCFSLGYFSLFRTIDKLFIQTSFTWNTLVLPLYPLRLWFPYILVYGGVKSIYTLFDGIASTRSFRVLRNRSPLSKSHLCFTLKLIPYLYGFVFL